MSDYRKRKSGIELLKVIGMFLIVFNNTMVLITRYPAFGPYIPKIFINIHIPSTDIINMIVQFIMYFVSLEISYLLYALHGIFWIIIHSTRKECLNY